jgi:hypothetical protein
MKIYLVRSFSFCLLPFLVCFSISILLTSSWAYSQKSKDPGESYPKAALLNNPLSYYEDFETGDGGWVPSGPTSNWEFGTIVAGTFRNCGYTAFPYPEPTGAHSGTKVWGTILDGCYTNFSGGTSLSKSFDFRAVPKSIELRWWQWFHIFEPYDNARVLVNGVEVWRIPNNLATNGWVQQRVSLSGFAGQPELTIQFVLEATSEVNRMGWYLDDIEISLTYSIYFPLIFKNYLE